MNKKLSKQQQGLIQNREKIKQQFIKCRQLTGEHCKPLQEADFNLQAIEETSPVKWHLAHTSWFFETFILKAYEPNFDAFDPRFEVLFNSYYNSIGEQHPRAKRYQIEKPSVKDVFEYRHNIEERILQLIDFINEIDWGEIKPLIKLGINHEQQHQELILSDLLFNLYQAADPKAYSEIKTFPIIPETVEPISWCDYQPELVEIGVCSDSLAKERAFAFDNELPRHKYWLEPFQLANRLVTNGEYLEFINDGGYKNSRLWLADGWANISQENWQAPLYWLKEQGRYYEYGLNGKQPLDLSKPVSHVSAYEADAFARWHGSRLATEQEWECAANQQVSNSPTLQQMFGHLWQWTSSAYQAYPGFKEDPSAVGEYNGKFMCNQLVLRGSSCITSTGHSRDSYRNFFYPDARWQFTGIRLARNL